MNINDVTDKRTEHPFGLDVKDLVAALRTFADEVESGNTLVHEVTLTGVAKSDDWPVQTRTVSYLDKAVPPGMKAGGQVKAGVTDAQIKHMVHRFLGWRLPDAFQPDAGITFKPEYNVESNAARGQPASRYHPIGTNLFDATQVDAMVRYMVEGLPK